MIMWSQGGLCCVVMKRILMWCYVIKHIFMYVMTHPHMMLCGAALIVVVLLDGTHHFLVLCDETLRHECCVMKYFTVRDSFFKCIIS